MPDEFDVFLSHNSRDKPIVEEIAARLRARGLRAWLDKWELRPGFPWQEGIEEGVRTSRAGAVFVGAAGLGAWQEPEMRAFITRSRREKVPVIPAQERQATGSTVLGAAAVLAQKPVDRPSRPKKSPAPLFHAFTRRVRRELYEAYHLFLAAFRDAAEKLRAGDRNAAFPLGSFPPGLPFVRALPPLAASG